LEKVARGAIKGRKRMTYREAIALGEKELNTANVADAKNDAWLLLAAACKIDHTFYYMHIDKDMDHEQVGAFEHLIHKRAEHIPLQYITGEQEFMGMNFHVNSNVLIPRQDTETLVEQALKRIKPGMHILDMCTGSGCVLISILKNAPGTTGVGCDISKQALIVAKENAKLNDISAEFERSDLFEYVMDKFDMIVSNPPYIRSAEIPTLMPEVAQFEPLIALDGKEDGLYFYRRIILESKDYLNEDGMLLFEIGYDQGQEVSRMMKEAGFSDVCVIKDLAENDRVVYGKLSLL
jgi:release factor glutamine methyltransferase